MSGLRLKKLWISAASAVAFPGLLEALARCFPYRDARAIARASSRRTPTCCGA